jgi:3-oxoacyl-[acyl-carrier protein] reductase
MDLGIRGKSAIVCGASKGLGRSCANALAREHPIPSLELSNGVRLGLTGAVAILARRAANRNVTINGILPGPFATDRLRSVHAKAAAARGVAVTMVDKERLSAVPAGRFGTPDEFGACVAFLCSTHAGYITGQNLLIDGGSYPGPL